VLLALGVAYANGLALTLTLVALLAAVAAVTGPAFSALTPAMVGRDRLAQASGIMQAATNGGLLAGPVLAGLLSGAFGTRVPLLADAATYLMIPLAALLIRTRRGGAHAEPVEPDTGGWTLWRDPLVRTVVLAFAVVVAGLTVADVAEVYLVIGTLHASTTVFGLLSGMWMAGLLVGSLLLTRFRPSDTGVAGAMLSLLGATSAVVVVTGLVPGAWWLGPLFLTGGIANGGENVLAGVLIGRRAPADRRGRAYATFGGTMNGATAVGFTLGGALSVVLPGPRFQYVFVGLVCLAICSWMVVRLRRQSPGSTPETATTREHEVSTI
jgi:MFS family permease